MGKTCHSTLPLALRRALGSSAAQNAWNSLTPIAQRDFLSWVNSAKQEQTRQERIARIPSLLAAGKRRPCCYAVVPMEFYTALNKKPKAKEQWRTLTPAQRRNILDRINSAKSSTQRAERVTSACFALAAGKTSVRT